ncbi:MAG: hypothetical protein VXW22_17450, partial [Pseudomonadota bacterium]|nr:hypothetical protein [Pseudomonadota bacterium]
MSAAYAKLRGGNAARITLDDLATTSAKDVKKPAVQSLLAEIVLGPPSSLRRALPSHGLTCEEQVDAPPHLLSPSLAFSRALNMLAVS